jgi:Flp pilus assembly protein TadD
MKTIMKTLIVTSAALLLTTLVNAADLQSEGRVHLAEGDAAAASKKFAEAAKVNPFDASALNNQAVSLQRRAIMKTH